METKLELSIRPNWDELTAVQTAVRGFLSTRGLAPDTVDALEMVSSELVENGLKYGTDNGEGDIELDVSVTPRAITVEVVNRLGNGPHDLQRLDRTIQWIRGHQTPFEAYLRRIEEISRRDPKAAENGLGLVRIAYEGQAVLDFYVKPDDRLAVSAVYPL